MLPGTHRPLSSGVGAEPGAILMEDPELWMEATLGAPAPEESGPAADDHAGDVALGSFRAAKERATGHWERGYLEALLRHCNGVTVPRTAS
jgi:hypothetical protein